MFDQEVQQELFNEINRVIGNEINVTDEHVENLKYMKNIVKESLR